MKEGSVTRRGLILGAAAMAAGAGAPAFVRSAQAQDLAYKLGDSTVVVRVEGGDRGRMIAFAPHSNETTSVAAARIVMSERGGKIVSIVNNEQRNITFRLGQTSHMVDPNRMFTDHGARASLRALGAYSEDAFRAVRDFATQVQGNVFQGSRLIFALHNNTDGGGYSFTSYLPGGAEAGNAARTYRNPDMDADDFVFVTSPTLFSFFEARRINVALQSGGAVDDGSLSVYCAQRRIPYVNIEAQSGHRSIQADMIRAACDILVIF